MEITNNQIYEKLISLELAIKAMSKVGKSDKIQILEDTIKDMKRIEVGQVQSLLNISRPWALNLMRKIGKENHFTFVQGDMKLKRPTIILYEEEQAKRERYNQLKEFVDDKKIVTFAQIREYLGIPERYGWLESVLSIAEDLTKNEKGYSIQGSRLFKNTINEKNS